ncbi:hypothetical protein GGX14DRAFT_609734 [Mycena pura]|uniref:Uncharacterized protein n=1 Tax=Mycena pura TaxID=153505 RepID=A0AAD6VS68_9AGAR|nr:hypothetical protein GGX14DRAFT_609734 [Mycena pura]
MTDTAVLHKVWGDMILQICMAAGGLLFYGIYLNLFFLALILLSRRKSAEGKKVLLAATWAMAVLETGQMIIVLACCVISIQIMQQILQSPHGPAPILMTIYNILSAVQNIAWAVNKRSLRSFYRCYIIWGRNWAVACVPGFLILSTFGIGCFLLLGTTQVPESIGFILVAVTNVVLMALTAGRIWWVRRAASHVGLDKTIRGRYTHVVAVILESGALFCICVILMAVTVSRRSVPGPEGVLYYVVVGISSQVMNIAPMLTIVRVGRGHNIQDSDTV